MECKDQQAEIDEMKTEKQKFCQPLITEGNRFTGSNGFREVEREEFLDNMNQLQIILLYSERYFS